jgi:hypothetical protein
LCSAAAGQPASQPAALASQFIYLFWGMHWLASLFHEDGICVVINRTRVRFVIFKELAKYPCVATVIFFV